MGYAGNLCRGIPSRLLESSASRGSTRAFSPVWFARLHALARIFAGRLAYLLARLYWFALPGHSLRDHCLFSHATADQPRADAAEDSLRWKALSSTRWQRKAALASDFAPSAICLALSSAPYGV